MLKRLEWFVEEIEKTNLYFIGVDYNRTSSIIGILKMKQIELDKLLSSPKTDEILNKIIKLSAEISYLYMEIADKAKSQLGSR